MLNQRVILLFIGHLIISPLLISTQHAAQPYAHGSMSPPPCELPMIRPTPVTGYAHGWSSPSSSPLVTFRSVARLNPASAVNQHTTRHARGATRSAAVEKDTNLVGKRATSASAIEKHMKQFIAGQDSAIDLLSLLAHRFLCNKLLVDAGKSPASKPSHCILTGPTGCGKSESLKRLGDFLVVPILYLNARSITDEGYKGHNFSEAVAGFCEENNSPSSAIVAIDEIDKLGFRGDEKERDFGRAIQRVLLSSLDGSPMLLKGRIFKMTNWWFVGTGAFSELQSIRDVKGNRATTARTHKDFIRAGFEPEFVGRFSTIIPFKGHTVETMLGVINREDSPLRKIQNEFLLFYGVKLTFEEAALRSLVKTSIEINLGVRSLYTILNTALQPFYEQAVGIMQTDAEKTLSVTLEKITPAITSFVEDNMEVDDKLSHQRMYT